MRGSPEPLTRRRRLELLESASPIAFAEQSHFPVEHAEYHFAGSFRARARRRQVYNIELLSGLESSTLVGTCQKRGYPNR